MGEPDKVIIEDLQKRNFENSRIRHNVKCGGLLIEETSLENSGDVFLLFIDVLTFQAPRKQPHNLLFYLL